MDGVADPGRPVGGGALVGALGDGVAGDEVLEADVVDGEVVAHRQAGLEEGLDLGGLGQHLALERHPHLPGRGEGVDAVVRVAGVDDDPLVLLEPLVEVVPRHGDVALDQGLGRAAGGHVLLGEGVVGQPPALVDEHGPVAVDDGGPALHAPDAPGDGLDQGDVRRAGRS